MKRLSGARVLVTGATGFIGPRLCAALARAGAAVHVMTHTVGAEEALGALAARVVSHAGDVGDLAALTRCVEEASPELVFHLARPRGADFDAQAQASLRLGAALAAKAPRLERLVRTAHAAPAARGRAADGELARALEKRYGLRVSTLELFQVYGPGQKEKDFPLSLVDAVLAGRPPAPVEGGAKDFVHVDDVVCGYLAAAQSDAALGRTIELGSGVLTPLSAAAAAAASVLGVAAPAVAAGPLSGHPADLTRARELLSWAPRVSFEDGIRGLAAWRRDGGRHGR